MVLTIMVSGQLFLVSFSFVIKYNYLTLKSFGNHLFFRYPHPGRTVLVNDTELNSLILQYILLCARIVKKRKIVNNPH